MSTEVTNSMALSSMIVSMIALVFSMISCALFVGFKNSTHKIEYLDPNFESQSNEEMQTELRKEIDEIEESML